MKKAAMMLILMLIAGQAMAQSSGNQDRPRHPLNAEAQAYKEWYDALNANDLSKTKDLSKATDLAIVYIEQYPEGMYCPYLRKWLCRTADDSHGVSTERGDYGSAYLRSHSESGISGDVGLLARSAAPTKPATDAASLKDGRTLLMQKVTEGNRMQINELLSNPADINTQENLYGRTALIYAVWRGNVAIIRALLAAGADVTMKDKKGRSAVEHAYLTENAEVIELFQKLK